MEKITQASPVETRKALEVANVYAKAGIRFVPVPVLSDSQNDQAVALAVHRLELLEKVNATD